ncbi:MAG TPA: CAP domain-containing protein [Solirubrobacterales bacterium]|nr:CAP domain-containing protein [Solirubrobacterales bacterium]
MVGGKGDPIGRAARLAPAAALLALLALLLAPAGAAADRCKGENKPVKPGNFAKSERVMLCLVNVHRAEHEVGALPMEPTLWRAARDHSADMVARRYFGHQNPEGENATERARRAGYRGGVGENIQTRSGGTPHEFFESFRRSADHNENMLRPSYAVAGIGFADGFAPEKGEEGGPGVTVTEDFGVVPTPADDHALDLLITSECDADRTGKKQAKRKLKRAKRMIRKAKRKGKKRKLRRAKRQKRAAKRTLKSLRGEIKVHCKPPGF